MLTHLIHRPIAVSMCVLALVVLGILSIRYIPVSLMPDIDIPQITVHASYPGASVRQIESYRYITRTIVASGRTERYNNRKPYGRSYGNAYF